MLYIYIPSSSGDLFKRFGLSFNSSFTSVTSPSTGAYISEAALTDSTAPICSKNNLFIKWFIR